MKNILFLTSRYLPNPSTNGLVTNYVSEELKKRGYSIICISVKNEGEKDFEVINGIEIYRISPSKYTIINENPGLNKFPEKAIKISARVLRNIKTTISIFNFPNFDLSQSKKVQKKAEYILNKKKINMVIAVNKPYSNVATVKNIKSKYLDVIFGVYYLDLINSLNRPKVLSKKIYDKLVQRDNLSVLEKTDFILIPPGGKKLYEERIFDDYRNKIYEIDFPTMLELNPNIEKNEANKKTVVTYAGTLDYNYRNPDKLLEILSRATKIIGKIDFNIYGNNNCEELFEKYKDNLLTINNHGKVSHVEVVDSMLKSDFLVNIGNKNIEAVPSKIFELFSTGKPIINIINSKNDVTRPYFDLYPLVFNYDTLNYDEKVHKKLVDFLINKKGSLYDTEKIKKMFYKNTPSYTADIIEQILDL